MSDQPTPYRNDIPDPHAGHGAWARGVIERQVALQEQLAEAALRLALAIEQGATQAVAQGRPVDKDAAMAFSRVARAVRMSGLLQARLIKDLEQGRQAQHRAEAEQLRECKRARDAWDEAPEDADHEDEPDTPAERRKYRVARIVEHVAMVEHADEDRLERLMDETIDRLDDEDLYGDVLEKPIGELVSLLCRDLGLKPDWARLSEEAWAREEIASGVEGSPFLSPLPLEGGEVGSGGERTTLKREALEAEPPPAPQSPISARTPPSPPFPPGGGRESEDRLHPFDRLPERPLAWSG